MRTYVLVPGSGGNGTIWASVQRELALRGQRSYAVDLPGHGSDARYSRAYQAPQDLMAWAAEPSSMTGVELAENVAHVVEIVRRVAEHGPVVLVGVSLGGVTISGVADQVPELLERIVYLSAWICTSLPSPVAYLAEPEAARSLVGGLGGFAVGAPEGVGRANYRTSDPDLLDALKAATMAEATDEQFLAAVNHLEPDESLAVMTADARVHPDRWGRVPRTYIRLLADRSLPVELQDRLIAEADAATPDNPFTVHDLDTSHMGFVLRAGEVADLLL
ncbi:alpha/beta hydrolase [Amycolatopsis sp. 195334CR]|uniref:alpha/beta hydrolase n=1 Tax=Amycolatopsis sp. 195334CR TaxID=2814588 RepID=UPI001A8EDADC|nr:alpha/beta fold hydrolase [Amycolatopsis sp. 195334CR]MBN6037103.1 alpha/beta fold hydrolase [Amycolatopsis sp. 195334CR]